MIGLKRIPRLVPDGTTLRFMAYRRYAFMVSGAVLVLALVMLVFKGLAFGIDFKGGVLIEVRTEQPAELSSLRAALADLGLGDVALQQAGTSRDVLIRIERQDGDETAQDAAVSAAKAAINEVTPGEVEYRRTEFVGPKVGAELRRAGTLAVVLAIVGVMIYLWFRFEWQFGVGAIAAVLHDVLATLFVFSLTGLEFNLSSIAAILTIVGYSLNDSVVIFDRVRENLRRYKAMPIEQLLDKSINETLARTVMTSATTLLALLSLYIFGGEVIRGFTFAMIFGVIVGTYSTVFISAPILSYFNLRAPTADEPERSPVAG